MSNIISRNQDPASMSSNHDPRAILEYDGVDGIPARDKLFISEILGKPSQISGTLKDS